MDQPEGFHQTYIHHTCTREELRFGTCNCRSRAVTQPVVAPSGRPGLRKERGDDRTWVADLRNQQEVRFNAELKRGLERLPSGRRIYLLRTVLGWSQGQAAMELGISRRTVIRHEQGQHTHPWMRLSLLERLRELESTYAEQLATYLRLARRESV